MNEQIKDGGPAFPVQELNGDGTHYLTHWGLSLRDWFAGQAQEMDIMIHQEWEEPSYGGNKSRFPKYTREQARYKYADAMLKAREVKGDCAR